ncbi:MAG: calcium/sodium antiporter [Firmicutes bacterium]|nr:calcium/sodium antiporter [Bacillota bacterium]
MNIWLEALLFAVGVVLIVKGGDVFVDAAGWIAEASGIPKFIVGATIVSVATTLPEMIVSVMATADGEIDMAVGNAVGSVTANTGLILALALIFMSLATPRRVFLPKILMLIASAFVTVAACLGGQIEVWGSVVLALLFVIFIIENIKNAKTEEQSCERPEVTKKIVAVKVIMFVLGAAATVGGSRLLVSSGTAIAEFLGVPSRIIAVTMVAVGTSLPELVTTVTAIVKKQASLSAGNVIGANIIDMTLILPVCSAVSGSRLPISAASVAVDFPVCLAVTLIAMLPLIIKQRSYKWQGILLLCVYAAYVAATVLL